MRILREEKITYKGAIEGQQEQLYFEHLQKLIYDDTHIKKKAVFNFAMAFGGSPMSVAEKANRSVALDDIKRLKLNRQLIAVYDYDFKKENFIKAIKYCEKSGIVCAYSNVNFDLWILIHKKKNFYKKINKCSGYEDELRKEFNLFLDEDIKEEKAIYKILKQITLEDVKNAVNEAKKIEQKNIENCNTISSLINVYNQPALGIGKFVEEVLMKCDILS